MFGPNRCGKSKACLWGLGRDTAGDGDARAVSRRWGAFHDALTATSRCQLRCIAERTTNVTQLHSVRMDSKEVIGLLLVNTAAKNAGHRFVNVIVQRVRMIRTESLHIQARCRAAVQESPHVQSPTSLK